MQGHIRSRGKRSFEYIVDVGMAQAQRCQSCGRRFWVERKLKEACPSCGGRLSETEERRRETKAGFRTRKEAQAAMSKVLVAVAEHSYVTPTKLTVREYLQKEWLPAIEATIRPTTYRSYVQHVECHICPHIGSVKLEKLSGAADQQLVRQARPERQARWQDGAFGALHPPRARRPAPSLEGRRQVGTTDA